MFLAVILASVSALSFAIANTFSGKINENGNVLHNLYNRGLITVGIFFVFFLVSLTFSPIKSFDFSGLLYAIGIGVFAFCGLLAFFKSLATAPVGLTIIISNTSIIYTILTSYLLFGTGLSSIQFFGIILALFGVYLIYSTKKHTKISLSGLKYAFLNSIIWGITFTFYRFGLSVGSPYALSFLVELFGFIFILLIFWKKRQPIPNISQITTKKHVFTLFIIIGIASAIGVNSRVIGQSLGNIPLVESIITALTPVFALVIARIWLKEKLMFQQFVGVIAILIGTLTIIMG
jgi:drug/metabolite transporter (DMT)-like permease